MKRNNLILLSIFFFTIISCDHFTVVEKTKTLSGEQWVINEEGDSVLNRYDEQGNLSSFTTYKNRRKHGLAKKFYPNGNTEFEISYVDGYKHGQVSWYYESGALYRTNIYEKNKIEGIQKLFYEDGTYKAEIPYKAGEVMPGTKEYTKEGKLIKNYPNINYETIDRLAFENKYILKVFLSNRSKSPKFYRLVSPHGSEKLYRSELHTKDGVGTFTWNLTRGGYIMEKFKVYAEYKSSFGNPVVLEKTINIAAKNR